MDYTSMSQLVVVSFLWRLFRAPSLLKWTLADEEKTLTSFHYQRRPSRSKHSFMSITGQSLSSVIYQNLIILHTGNAEQALFYFSTASLPLKCELQTSQACLTPSRPPSPCCFYSPRFIPFSSRPASLFIARFLTLALYSPFLPLCLLCSCAAVHYISS